MNNWRSEKKKKKLICNGSNLYLTRTDDGGRPRGLEDSDERIEWRWNDLNFVFSFVFFLI